MGKHMRAYKVDNDAYSRYQQWMMDIIGSFIMNGGRNTVNENVEGEYLKWVRQHQTDDKVLEEIDPFVDALSADDLVENTPEAGDCLLRLKRLYGIAKEVRDNINGITLDEDEGKRRERLINIQNGLDELAGTDTKPGLGETLRAFDKATGYKFAKNNLYRALHVLSDQVTEAIIGNERRAISDIANDVPDYRERQNQVLNDVENYNREAVAYYNHMESVLAVENEMLDGKKLINETMEGNYSATEKSLEEINEKYQKAHEEWEAAGDKVVAVENEITQANSDKRLEIAAANAKEEMEDAKGELNEADTDLKTAQEELENAKRVMETATAELKSAEEVLSQKEAIQPTDEEIQRYLTRVSTNMDKLTEQQKVLIDQYDVNSRAIEDLKKDIDNNTADFVTKKNRVVAAIEKEMPLFDDKDELHLKHMEEASEWLKNTSNKNSLLNGTLSLTADETNALIEAVRTGSKSDIAKLSSKSFEHGAKMADYYELLKSYATAYDVLHKDEPEVSIKGKMTLSVSRSRTVGVKAAIDLLEETFEHGYDGVLEPIPFRLRQNINKLKVQIDTGILKDERLSKAKHVATLRAENEKLQKEYDNAVDKIKRAIEAKERDNEKLLAKNMELSEQVGTEREHNTTLVGDSKDKAIAALKELATADARKRKDDAEKSLNKAKETVESLTKNIEEKKSAKAEAETAFSAKEAAYNKAQKKADERAEEVAKLPAKLKEAERERDLASGREDRLLTGKTTLENSLQTQKEYMEKLQKANRSCKKNVIDLKEQLNIVAPRDNRFENLKAQINSFWDDVEAGNMKKPNGKWDHKNGTHYTALKNQLEELKDALNENRHIDYKKKLTDLRDAADSYLEARSHDFGARLTGGSLFRFKRLSYATTIRSYCDRVKLLIEDVLPPVDSHVKELFDRSDKVDELIPDLKFGNIALFKNNQNLQTKKEPDAFTVLSDDLQEDRFTAYERPGEQPELNDSLQENEEREFSGVTEDQVDEQLNKQIGMMP